MPIMYKTLNIYIRKYGQNPSVEAFGPNGEWAEECTEMPSEEDSQVLSQSLRVPGSLEELGDRLGRALMPGSVLQLYTEVLQRTLAYPNQGLRLKLHFMGSADEYKSFPWEMIRINGRSIVLDPHQTIVRTVDRLEPAIPLALEKA